MKLRSERIKHRKHDGGDLRVFVTRPIAEPALRRLAAIARVDLWDDEMPPPAAELRARARQADGVLSMVTDPFDAAMIRALPRLRAISNLAVGVDNIDLAAATRAGVAVGHTPGILTETTADLAFGLLMAAARRIAEGDRYVRGGRWRTWGPKVMLGRDIHGATLGIIGWGAIGQAMARRAAGFGMRVLYLPGPAGDAISPKPSRASIRRRRAIAGGAHDPAAAAGGVGLRFAARAADCRDSSHDRRGRTRDDEAERHPDQHCARRDRGFAGARRCAPSGTLGGAGLDVTDPEPIGANDPLLELPNVVITPHIGSASHATRLQMAELAVDNLIDVFEGRRPRNCANPAVRMR